ERLARTCPRTRGAGRRVRSAREPDPLQSDPRQRLAPDARGGDPALRQGPGGRGSAGQRTYASGARHRRRVRPARRRAPAPASQAVPRDRQAGARGELATVRAPGPTQETAEALAPTDRLAGRFRRPVLAEEYADLEEERGVRLAPDRLDPERLRHPRRRIRVPHTVDDDRGVPAELLGVPEVDDVEAALPETPRRHPRDPRASGGVQDLDTGPVPTGIGDAVEGRTVLSGTAGEPDPGDEGDEERGHRDEGDSQEDRLPFPMRAHRSSTREFQNRSVSGRIDRRARTRC